MRLGVFRHPFQRVVHKRQHGMTRHIWFYNITFPWAYPRTLMKWGSLPSVLVPKSFFRTTVEKLARLDCVDISAFPPMAYVLVWKTRFHKCSFKSNTFIYYIQTGCTIWKWKRVTWELNFVSMEETWNVVAIWKYYNPTRAWFVTANGTLEVKGWKRWWK